MKIIEGVLTHSSKTEKFLMILLAIAIVSTLLTLGVQEILNVKEKKNVKVLLVAPFSDHPNIAKSMQQGALAYTHKNNSYKYSAYNFIIDTVDENDPNLAEIIQEKYNSNKYTAILGFYSFEVLQKSIDMISKLNIPILSLSNKKIVSKNLYSFIHDENYKAKFIANYMRNVKKEHTAYMAHDNSLKCQQEQKEFEIIYKRFEIPLVGTVTTKDDIKSYFEKVDFGAVYVCGDGNSIPDILNSIKESKTVLSTYSNEILALKSTHSKFKNSSNSLHDISVPSPLINDIANEKAQIFFNQYKKLYEDEPDWLGALSHDMVKIAFEHFIDSSKKIFHGTIREYNLNENVFILPVKMGLFNGDKLISAPIQLQNISTQRAISNYIDAMRESRVLYVNRQFMYKTNVVYTGIIFNSIGKIKQEEGTAEIDFNIWFRYGGKFDPSEITFLNSDVTLEEPEEKIDKEDDHYVLYRAKGIFKLNYNGINRSYGLNTINVIYRHKKLNNNNLLFVTDILGMPSNLQITKNIKERQVIEETEAWIGSEFWISQSLVKNHTQGKPQFIGYQGEKPLFSTINVELKIESSVIHAKDYIEKKYFLFLMMFGLVGMISGMLMDIKKLGRYWHVHSYILRLVFVPMFLMGGGNITLDWAYINLSMMYTGYLVLFYESLWWILSAYLLDMGIRRFTWGKIEEKAKKKVPGIIVVLTSFVIYSLTFSGIIAFIFDQELTSVLAASGIIAAVIGLALQTNIANVFSGLVLNIDRPFRVGDMIEVDDMYGYVLDIGWRTTKIQTWDGMLIYLPNDQITNAQTKNLTNSEAFYQVNLLHLHPGLKPVQTVSLIKEALEKADYIIKKDDDYYGCKVSYLGLEVSNDIWVTKFEVKYSIGDYLKTAEALDSMWTNLYEIFKRERLPLYPKNDYKQIERKK